MKFSTIHKRITALLLVFALLLHLPLSAQQQMPVRTITNVAAPYPVNLEQFSAIDENKLTLTIIPNDIKLTNYPIRLKLVISNGSGTTISSSPSFIHRHLALNHGEILTFSGADLAEWFKPENLDFAGFSKNQYLQSGRLPEGMYQVWFEVYEPNYGYNMSSSTKAMVWLFENDPPLLNLPLQNKEVPAVDPQNIAFNWTLRQAPFSGSGASNQFTFELWEVLPDNMNVDEVVRTARPIYSSTQNASTLVYTAAEPLLVPGRKYAWRVTVSDAEGKRQFKNQGRSLVYSFRFGKVCGVPSPSIDKLTENSIQVKWSNESIFDRYELRYRNKNKQDAKWYPVDGGREGAKISNLEVNTQYEIQVHGFCGEQDGGYSPSLTTRTKEALSFNCGQNMGAIDLSNKQPLQALKVGDYFHAADFDVMVSEVTGSNGNFTGKGFVRISMLNFIKFQAEFKSIKVNTDYRMIDGEVRLINDPQNPTLLNLSNALRALNEVVDRTTGAEVFDKNADETKVVDGKIASISVDSKGRATVTLADGTTKTVDTDSKNKFTAITSKSGGDRYMVSNTGDIYKGTPDKTTGKSLDGKKASSYSITFNHDEQEAYGLDLPGGKQPDGGYESTTIGGDKQLVAWKSIENGTLDRVVAKIEGSPADSIHFATQSGTMVMAAKGKTAGTSQLLIAGTGDDALKAWYLEASDTTKNKVQAGQLNLVAYDKQTIKLCLVGINGAAVPNANYVRDELNKIYSPAVVDWTVSQFTKNIKLDLPSSFAVAPPDGKMDYSTDEKLVRDSVMDNEEYDPSFTYLIFIDNPTSDPSTMGFMPFNRQFGFIFCKNTNVNNTVRTMAHELGHGCFRLRHTFSTDNQFVQEKGSTDNLMDYVSSSPTVLRKYQWDETRKSHWGINWFEDGSGAMANGENNILIIQTQETRLIKDDIISVMNAKIEFGLSGYVGSDIEKIEYAILKDEKETIKSGIVTRDFTTTESIDKSSILAHKDFSFVAANCVDLYNLSIVMKIKTKTKEDIITYTKNNRIFVKLKPQTDYLAIPMQYLNNIDLLYFGCKWGKGATDETNCIEKIWTKIQGGLTFGDFGRRQNSEVKLTYYKTNTLVDCIDAVLVSDKAIGDGQCGVFAEIFAYPLILLGVNDVEKYQITSKNSSESFLVKNWNFNQIGTEEVVGGVHYTHQNKTLLFKLKSSKYDNAVPEVIVTGNKDGTTTGKITEGKISNNPTDLYYELGNRIEKVQDNRYEWYYAEVNDIQGIAGQGNENPYSNFGLHYVVKIKQAIYDPSYSKYYKTEDEWNRDAIDGFYRGAEKLIVIEDLITNNKMTLLNVYIRKNQ